MAVPPPKRNLRAQTLPPATQATIGSLPTYHGFTGQLVERCTDIAEVICSKYKSINSGYVLVLGRNLQRRFRKRSCSRASKLLRSED